MSIRTMGALVAVEWKKLYRDIMNLIVMILMPVGLTLIIYLALGGVSNDYYPPGVDSHFEFLLPGLMGYSIIYMGMMVALGLVDYREAGILKRIQATPLSPTAYLGSQIIAYMVIAVVQAFIVLLVARLLGFVPQGGLLGLLLACPFLALLGITAVGLGLITATVAKNSGAAGGLAVIYILPMMMFGAWLAVFDEATLHHRPLHAQPLCHRYPVHHLSHRRPLKPGHLAELFDPVGHHPGHYRYRNPALQEDRVWIADQPHLLEPSAAPCLELHWLQRLLVQPSAHRGCSSLCQQYIPPVIPAHHRSHSCRSEFHLDGAWHE